MEDFVRFALSEGFTSYGFSSHAPLPFSTAWTMEWDRMNDYLAEFHRIKEKYAGKIELYLGLEIDYLNEESNPSAARFRELPLDYRIGSVHMLYNERGEVVDVDVRADPGVRRGLLRAVPGLGQVAGHPWLDLGRPVQG